MIAALRGRGVRVPHDVAVAA
ncbi:hypothetical protein AB0F83_29905 [Micromonospora chalcea]